jgi:hypothetical protein
MSQSETGTGPKFAALQEVQLKDSGYEIERRCWTALDPKAEVWRCQVGYEFLSIAIETAQAWRRHTRA